MRRHPELGAQILEHQARRRAATGSAHTTSARTAAATRTGWRGDAIPLEARILAVADAYEAMTSDRSYRAAIGHEDARAELRAPRRHAVRRAGRGRVPGGARPRG